MEETAHCTLCAELLPSLVDLQAAGLYVCTNTECTLYGVPQMGVEQMEAFLAE